MLQLFFLPPSPFVCLLSLNSSVEKNPARDKAVRSWNGERCGWGVDEIEIQLYISRRVREVCDEIRT